MATEIETELDLGQDEPDEVIPEPTLGQKLSRMNRQQLMQEIRDRELPGNGTNVELIQRIEAYEENGKVLPERDYTDLKPGLAPAPPEPTTQPSAAGEVNSASAPAADAPPARPQRQKVGFFAATNTYRAEFPVGPRGTLDDATHMEYIESTHNAARAEGYIPKGAPHAGTRVGRSVIEMPDGSKMASVIYEVFARREE